MLSGLGPNLVNNELQKKSFFYYTNEVLYKSNYDLKKLSDPSISKDLPINKKWYKYDIKKLKRFVLWLLLVLLIRSICQYWFGIPAPLFLIIWEHLSDWQTIGAAITGHICTTTIGDNLIFIKNFILNCWNFILNCWKFILNNWKHFFNYFTLRLDSDDESSKNFKGKGKGKAVISNLDRRAYSDDEAVIKSKKGKVVISDSDYADSDNEAEIKSIKGKEKMVTPTETVTVISEEAKRIHGELRPKRLASALEKLGLSDTRLYNYMLANNHDVTNHPSLSEFYANASLRENYMEGTNHMIKVNNDISNNISKMRNNIEYFNEAIRENNNIININNNYDVIAENVLETAKKYSIMDRDSQLQRMMWLRVHAHYLEMNDMAPVIQHILKMQDAYTKLGELVEKMKTINDNTTAVYKLKLWYAEYNKLKNIFSKELNKAELITMKAIKSSPFCTLRDNNCKTAIEALNNYNKVKDKLNTEDNYLKKKIGEIVNRKK